MPQNPAEIVTWNDFSGGDYGTLGGRRAETNQFKASNMIVRANGRIGPRAGIKDFTPASMPTGTLLGFSVGPVVGREGLFIIGKTPYRFDLYTPATAPTALSDFAQTPNQPVKPRVRTANWLVPINYGASSPDSQDGVYVVNPSADTNTKITGSMGGIDVVQEGQQMIVARSQFYNQIDGSSAIDPTDWSGGIFADVGDDWQVTALNIMKNVLVVIKRTGWWILSGVLGDSATETFRQASTADGVLHSWQADMDQKDTLWFFPLFQAYPGLFNGAVIQYMGNLTFPTREHDEIHAVPPLTKSVTVFDGHRTASSVAYIQGGSSQKMLLQHNGVWTFHDFGVTISAMAAKNGDQLVITDGGGASTAAKIYSVNFWLERPAFVSDELVSPGDGSTTPLDASLTLSQHWTSDRREVHARQLVVDFVSFDTGTTATAHFDIQIRTMGTADQDGNGVDSYSAVQSWDQAVSASSTDGTLRRHVFEFSEPPGSGIEVLLTNVRNVDFDSFTLLDPQQAQRPVG